MPGLGGAVPPARPLNLPATRRVETGDGGRSTCSFLSSRSSSRSATRTCCVLPICSPGTVGRRRTSSRGALLTTMRHWRSVADPMAYVRRAMVNRRTSLWRRIGSRELLTALGRLPVRMRAIDNRN